MESDQINNVPQSVPPAEAPQSLKSNKKWMSSLAIIILAAAVGYFLSTNNNTMSDTNTDYLPYFEVKPMTETEYDPYLKQKISGFNEGGISQNLGFALITFYDNDPATKTTRVLGDFGLEIRMVPIPNLVAFKNEDVLSVKIHGAFNAAGTNVLRVDEYALDEELFQSIIGTRYLETPTPNLLAFAVGNVSEGSVFDIQKVEGVLRLKLPVTTPGSEEVSYVTKDYPFVLMPHAETDVVVNKKSNELSPEQLKIQESFVAFKKIIETKDDVSFITYLSKVQGFEDVKDENSVADDAVKEQMEQFHVFFKDITPEDFASDATVWTTTEEEITVAINKKDAYGLGETITLVFIKIDTAWYLKL
jgi:hypothetical protein